MIIKKPCVIESIEKSTPNVNIYRLRIQDNTVVDFVPGMFAMLYYKDPETNEEIGRAYSIASEPNVSYFDFMIELVHGKLTSKLENAKVGDVYYISAPYGQFKFDPSAGKKFLFLAGGTGLAPFFSMIKYAISKKLDVDIAMIYSVRFPSWIIAKDALSEFAKSELPKISINITITRPQPGDGWNGQTGHIDEAMIQKYVPDFAERIAYICGPLNFVKAMKQACSNLKIPETNIKTEMWGQ
ncbi:MAG: ferredoxin--NADP reductase [Candidatus Micrarchaeia archaeon]